MTFTVSKFLLLIAVIIFSICFVLAIVGTTIGGVALIGIVALGLAFFAASFLVP